MITAPSGALNGGGAHGPAPASAPGEPRPPPDRGAPPGAGATFPPPATVLRGAVTHRLRRTVVEDGEASAVGRLEVLGREGLACRAGGDQSQVEHDDVVEIPRTVCRSWNRDDGLPLLAEVREIDDRPPVAASTPAYGLSIRYRSVC